MAILSTVISRGTRASQPAASGAAAGSLYYVTDEKVIERSTGSVWESFSLATADLPTDATLVFTDITTNNSSTSKHGFLKKLDNDATHFMDGTGSWSVPSAVSAGFTLLATTSMSGLASFDVTNLSSYSEIFFGFRAVSLTSSGIIQVRVSTDNGSTFLSASGDYVSISGAGAETNLTNIPLYGNTTVARTGQLTINAFNKTTPKFAQAGAFFSADSLFEFIIPTTTALNAVRVLNSSGGNFNGGTFYTYGR